MEMEDMLDVGAMGNVFQLFNPTFWKGDIIWL